MLLCVIDISIAPPKYSPSGGSALISKPYYFEFNYSGSLPDHYKWYKNGHRYSGEGGNNKTIHIHIQYNNNYISPMCM